MSPQGQGTSPVLSQQTRHRPHQVDDWHSDWNTQMWMILHDPGPQWQSLQKEQSPLEAYMSQWFILSRPSSEKREETAQRPFLSWPSDQPGQIRVIWEWSELYGHQVHDVWQTRDTSNTPTITIMLDPQHRHPQGATHLDHPHSHHQHHFHPESHPWSPAQRTPHLKAGRDTSLNQLSSDPETSTKDSHVDFQLS